MRAGRTLTVTNPSRSGSRTDPSSYPPGVRPGVSERPEYPVDRREARCDLSPDDPQRDLVTKRSEYAQAGIPEYWIVNPTDGTITVLHLDRERYAEHGRYTRGEVAHSAQYTELAVAVGDALDTP